MVCLTRQWPYNCLTDRFIFFQSGLWPGPPVTISRSHRPVFFHFFFKHIFAPEHQWLYHSLTDRVLKFFFPIGFSTQYVISHMTVSQTGFYIFLQSGLEKKKKWKNPVCETVIWSLAYRVKNLIEIKWLGLWDSDMVTGGLSLYTRLKPTYDKKIGIMGLVYIFNQWAFNCRARGSHFKPSAPFIFNFFFNF